MEVLYKWSQNERKKEQSNTWLVTESPGREEDYDHLVITDSTVKWYKGLRDDCRVLQTSYTVQNKILQVLWCTFGKRESVMRCLCVREKGQLTLFMINGTVHYIPLPFEVESVWSVNGVLLIERKGDTSEDNLAVLFTISHPLDDICPVACRRPSFLKDSFENGSMLAYMTSSQLHVAAVCPDHTPPLIITYDTRDNTHTLWAVQPATSRDIPSPGSTPGPGGIMILTTARTPGGPLSSSAPARYIHHSPGSAIKFSLRVDPSPTLPLTNKRRSLLTPLNGDSLRGSSLKRLQQKGSPFGFTPSPLQKVKSQIKGVDGVIDSGKVVSGRSPFVNRYVTPKSDNKVKTPKSPQLHYARISPHSQAINSWNNIYTDQSLIDSLDFLLLPQICLHQVWTELPETEAMIYHSCTSAFVTNDFSGEELLCLHISSLNQLRLLSLTKVTTDDSLSTNDISIITKVQQVINFSQHKLMLVLSTEGAIFLYTGSRKVIQLDFSMGMNIFHSGMNPQHSGMSMSPSHSGMSLLPSGTIIRDPIGSEFTVVTSDGRCYQCCIHSLPTHTTVSLCLKSLSCTLPSATVTDLMIAYYNYSCTWNENEDVWNRFETWLLACVGVAKAINYTGTSSITDPLIAHDPVLKLIHKLETKSEKEEKKDIVIDIKDNVNSFLVHLEGHLSCITSGLHLVYEELKLNVHLRYQLEQLGRLLYSLTSHLGWQQYMDHYWRDTPSLLIQTSHTLSFKMESVAMGDNRIMLYMRTMPPSIFQTIYSIFQGRKFEPYPVLGMVCKRTEQIFKIYSSLVHYWNTVDHHLPLLYELITGTSSSSLVQETGGSVDYLMDLLTKEDFTVNHLQSYPIGVTLPILRLLFHCRAHPKSTWSLSAYSLIGREDIGKTIHGERQNCSIKYEHSETNDDGMLFDEEILKVRFPSDLRIKEVKRLLSSSEPVRIAIEQKPEVSDHEFVEVQEALLLTLSQRTMSLPVGRGMFTLSTVHPLPTAPLQIPKLNLTGRVPPRNSTVSLDNVDKPPNMTDWPQFHNGVAAGLKIAPGVSKLDSTWIVFNQPSEDQGINEYAGFLMALGLHGHLTSLSTFNTFEYLQDKHELTVIALLLGTSAAMCGSMDRGTASTFSIFFPPLLPPDSADLETSVLMQMAAAVSLGLLYMGSCNRFMMETMLNQIGHSPGPELKFGTNRESYSLCAGLALGMIAINSGGSAMMDGFNLVDQLCVYINGGLKKDVMASDTASTSHLVLESSQVNIHVTAPGAILALGLIYLKSNNRQIAAHLAPPTTPYQFGCVHVRPDFLLLRALASGMILWDDIAPTQDWISNQIPQITHQFAFNYGKPLEQVMSQAFLYITTGCSLAIGLKFAGSCLSEAYDCLFVQYKMIMSHQSEQIGKYCLDTCILVVLLSLSLVMAGSGDLNVLRLIRRHHTHQSSDSMYGHQMATHMSLGLLFLGGGRYCIGNSNKAIAGLVCSLYPHFPSSSVDNRYHLQALRHLYVLATEPRVLMTKDYHSDQLCSVPVQLHIQINGESEVLERKTPCLLPNWNQLVKVEVMGPRYWPVQYELAEESVKESLMKTGTVYVKRRSGYSSYESDPWGQESVLSLAVLSPSQYQLGGINGIVNIPSGALQDDPYVKQFYTHLCNGNKLYSALLLDSIDREELELLRLYLRLEETCTKPLEEISVSDMWQAKLSFAFSKREDIPHTLKDYTERIIMLLNSALGKINDHYLSDLVYSYITGRQLSSLFPLSAPSSHLLSLILTLQDVPYITPDQSSDKLIMKLRSTSGAMKMTPLAIARTLHLHTVH